MLWIWLIWFHLITSELLAFGKRKRRQKEMKRGEKMTKGCKKGTVCGRRKLIAHRYVAVITSGNLWAHSAAPHFGRRSVVCDSRSGALCVQYADHCRRSNRAATACTTADRAILCSVCASCVCVCVCVHYHFAMQRHYPVLRNVRSPGERSDSELQRAFWVIEERPSHEEHTKTVQSNASQSAAIFRHTTLSLQNIPATHTIISDRMKTNLCLFRFERLCVRDRVEYSVDFFRFEQDNRFLLVFFLNFTTRNDG